MSRLRRQLAHLGLPFPFPKHTPHKASSSTVAHSTTTAKPQQKTPPVVHTTTSTITVVVHHATPTTTSTSAQTSSTSSASSTSSSNPRGSPQAVPQHGSTTTHTSTTTRGAHPGQASTTIDPSSAAKKSTNGAAIGVTIGILVVALLIGAALLFRRWYMARARRRSSGWPESGFLDSRPRPSDQSGSVVDIGGPAGIATEKTGLYDARASPVPLSPATTNNSAYDSTRPPLMAEKMRAPPAAYNPIALGTAQPAISSYAPPQTVVLNPAPTKPIISPAPISSPFFTSNRDADYAPPSSFKPTGVNSARTSQMSAPFPAPNAVPIPAGVANATVRRTYIPTLPDELSISTGDAITILSSYDDGWALCANVRGEEGVVPLECLALVSSPTSARQGGQTLPAAAPSSWSSHAGTSVLASTSPPPIPSGPLSAPLPGGQRTSGSSSLSRTFSTERKIPRVPVPKEFGHQVSEFGEKRGSSLYSTS